MYKRSLIIISFILILIPTVWTKEFYSLSKINCQQALSNSAVLSIFQDEKRFMWFGTYDGLNFYDGKTVHVYRSDNSGGNNRTLLNNIIEELSSADNGCMWISTATGINKFSLKQHKIVESFDSFNLPINLNSNKKGDTWILVKDTLYYYNTFYHQFLPISKVLEKHNWEHAFVDEKGALWIFPISKAIIYKYELNKFDEQNKEKVTVTISPINFHSQKIAYACHQNGLLIFIDKQSDLFLYDQRHNTKVYIRNIAQLLEKYGPIEGIVSFNGDILIAFRENGLIKLDATQHYEDIMVDPNIRIFTIYKDPIQDIVWIATDGQGVLLYSKNYSLAVNVILDRLSDNLTRPVRSILTDKLGNLWFGTKGDGLVRMNNTKGRNDKKDFSGNVSIYFPGEKKDAINYTRSLSEFQIFALKESRFMNAFWIGAADAPGLLYYDYLTDKVIPVVGKNDKLRKVHTIYEESDSIIWATTSGSGLCKILINHSKSSVAIDTIQQFFFHKQQKVLNDFYSLINEGDSLLWLGSRGMGLVKFNTKTEKYQIYSLDENNKKKSVNDILSIYREGETFYLGTVSGLVRLKFNNHRNTFTVDVISKENGLLNDMIHGILKDKNGFLWLSTNKGLVKYNPSNGSTHSYYYSNGLEVGEFCDDAYYTCPYTGNLFFGGINGLLCLMKDKVNENEYYPDVSFQNLRIGQNEVNFSDHYSDKTEALILHGASVTFSISFVAPDFIRGADFEYSYLLEGSRQKLWSTFSSENTASFSKLSYGDYTLKVRYKKDVFDTEYKSYALHIIILPPWYFTWQAYLLYLLLFIVGIMYIYYIVRKYYRRERVIKELIAHERRNQSDEQRIKWREIMDAFSLICINSGELKRHKLLQDSNGRLDAIHEIAIEMALKLGTYEVTKWNFNKFTPNNYAVYCQISIQELSDEVRSFLAAETEQHMPPPICLNIPEGLTFSLYKNAFRHILYYLYNYSYKQPLSISFTVTAEGLILVISSPEKEVDKLWKDLKEFDLDNITAKDTDQLFLTQLLQQFYQQALVRLQASISRTNQAIYFSIPLFQIDLQEELDTDSKQTLLLLEDRGEMVWLIHQQLGNEYTIHHVRTIQEAFIFLKKHTPTLFIINVLMYLNEESKLLEYIQSNRTLLMRTVFIPLMTWKSVSIMHDLLEKITDAYVVMPYDLLFLKGIAARAIREKQSLKEVVIEGLGEAGSEIVCSSIQQADFIKRMIRVIDNNLDREDLGSTFIADQMSISSRQFYRKFKEISGNSPSDFIKNYRMEKAARLLITTTFSIQEVINDVGISSRSYFYKEFMRKYGQTPKDYRELIRSKTE